MMSTEHGEYVIVTLCHSQRQLLEDPLCWLGEWMGEVGSLLRHGSTNEGGPVCTEFIRLTLGEILRVFTHLADA